MFFLKKTIIFQKKYLSLQYKSNLSQEILCEAANVIAKTESISPVRFICIGLFCHIPM